MTWWKRLWHRQQMEEQLDRELRFHLDQQAAELIARGCNPDEARRQARLALGGPEQVKEICRDARGTRWLEELARDFQYALRMLRQRPGFAVIALSTLALGIGATTVMFTVINGVLLKPLPYSQANRLVTLQGHTELYGDQNFAYADFLDCRSQSRSLASMAGYIFNWGTLSDPGEAENVEVREISANMFSVLGVTLLRGRDFLAEEDRPGGTPVVILGYGLWQRRFGGSADAIGMSLVLDAKRYTVVGIARADFRLGGEPDILSPLGQNTAGYMHRRKAHPLGVVARLRPGSTLNQAQTELAGIGGRLAAEHPDSNAGRSFVVEPLRPDVGDVQSTLWLLMGAVGLVLLIACANVASLLLARAVSRERELAMRVALGAGRARLMRQCLTESATLGLSGGLLGLLLAAAGIRPFVAWWPGSLPRAEEVRLDWRVLLFTIAASLLIGLLFGLAPALHAPSGQLEQALRAGTRTVVGSSRRLHSTFVISQISLAVVLLVAAGMLGRTILRLSGLDPGMNIHNLLVARMRISPGALTTAGQIRAAWQDVLDRARRVPGVQSAAMVDTVPMREGNNQLAWSNTPAIPPENQRPLALATSVTPDYLKVMGIRLERGRFFDERDRLDNEPVIVIDDVLAKTAFGRTDPVGRRLWFPDMSAGPLRVVGVVRHVRHWGLAGDDDSQVRAQVYYPFAQVPDILLRRWSEIMSIAVRTGVPPLNLAEPLRREVRGASNDQVLYEIRTMERLAGDTLARQRFLLLLFGIFAALALLLACLGIYGVLAYVTSQRVPEFGLRMALGATAPDVVRLVLRQSLGMLGVGVAVGVSASLAADRVLRTLVTGVRGSDPLTFLTMVAVLVAAALFASFVPARRAGRVDPIRALRQE